MLQHFVEGTHTGSQSVRRLVDSCIPTFDDFWKAWPRREAKKDAKRAWDKMRPGDRVAALASLPAHIEQWRREGRARCHIPHPATWLNGERWEDDFDPIPGIAAAPRVAGASASAAPAVKPWPCAWSTIVAKGAELGLLQASDEMPHHYKTRVFAAAGLTDAERRRILADYGVRV